MSTNGVSDPGSARLLRLVQLCDSALPIGAFSHSWGLETAIARGHISGPADLESWASAWLANSVASADGLIVVHAAKSAAAEDWEALNAINDLVSANKTAPTLRRASLMQGSALLRLAAGWPWSGLIAACLGATSPGPWHQATVFGAVAHAAGALPREAMTLYLQNAAAGLIAAAVRAVPIGHTHGQQILARLHPLFSDLASRWSDASLDCFGGLSPAYEVLAHAQTQLYTRLFQS